MIERGGLYFFTATVTQDCEMLNTKEIRIFFIILVFMSLTQKMENLTPTTILAQAILIALRFHWTSQQLKK